MDGVKDFVKSYWPYIVGAVVGLFIILRYAGGSSASSGDAGYSSIIAGQTAAGQANAQLQAQITMAENANKIERDKLAAQIAYDTKDLDIKSQAVASEAFNNFQTTQAAMAGAIGSSTSSVLNSLFAPSITAMAAGAQENAAALEAAGNVAASSFTAQGNIVGQSAQTSGILAQILGSVMQTVSQPEQKTDWAGVINAGANAYSTYATGGMMNGGGGGGQGNFGSYGSSSRGVWGA